MTACQNCKFFSLVDPATSKTLGLGECRRKPPKQPADQIDRWDPVQAIFPTVFTNNWCGEFKPQTDLTNPTTITNGQHQLASEPKRISQSNQP